MSLPANGPASPVSGSSGESTFSYEMDNRLLNNKTCAPDEYVIFSEAHCPQMGNGMTEVDYDALDRAEESDDNVDMGGLDWSHLEKRGKGSYKCTYGTKCTKGGVDDNGCIVIFKRNCMFRFVLIQVVLGLERPHSFIDQLLTSYAGNTWQNTKSPTSAISLAAPTKRGLQEGISLTGIRPTSDMVTKRSHERTLSRCTNIECTSDNAPSYPFPWH